MSSRDRERGRGGQRVDSPHGFSRRNPPPDATGAEATYLASLQSAKRSVVLKLLDGSTVRGVISNFDTDDIEIDQHSGAALRVRRSKIRLLHPEN